MRGIIYPENLNNHGVISFFTDKNFDLIKFSEKYKVYLPIQKHTERVTILMDDRNPEVADGVITKKRGVFLAVKVADCVPILLFDKVQRVIAAVHAGWRSTAKGILKNAIDSMVENFQCNPKNILIAMGPSIRGCCYEVGNEVIDALRKQTSSEEFIFCHNGKRHVDLTIANKLQALSRDIMEGNIWISSLCTYCNSDNFASYRLEGKKAGRQYGIIGML